MLRHAGKQTQNRPIEALDELRESIALNDNRAVYRSRLLLDQDAAAREATLARVFEDLGYQRLGVLSAADALGQDPTNSSAHRLLADIYAQTPRYDTARVSESLQSQLLQPLSLTPVQPTLVTRDLNILHSSGSTQAGTDEFTPLFVSNTLRFNGSAVVGNNDTLGDEMVLSGLHDRFAFSLGQYHYQTEGFRENNDFTDDIVDAFGQVAFSPALSAQVELRTRHTDHGDLRLDFDTQNFSKQDRLTVDQNTQRIGLRWQTAPSSTVLLSGIHHDRQEDQTVFGSVNRNDTATDAGYQLEVQWLWRHDRANLLLGAGYYDIDASRSVSVDFTPLLGIPCPAPSCTSSVDFVRRAQNAYGYLNFNLPRPVTWTVGLAAVNYQDGQFEQQVANPKFGVVWDVTRGVRARAAAVRTLKPARVVDQTLEPTQVAGFNQFFDDFNGTVADRYYLGLDLQPTSRLAIGAHGDAFVPVLDPTDNSLRFQEPFGEQAAGAYAYRRREIPVLPPLNAENPALGSWLPPEQAVAVFGCARHEVPLGAKKGPHP